MHIEQTTLEAFKEKPSSESWHCKNEKGVKFFNAHTMFAYFFSLWQTKRWQRGSRKKRKKIPAKLCHREPRKQGYQKCHRKHNHIRGSICISLFNFSKQNRRKKLLKKERFDKMYTTLHGWPFISFFLYRVGLWSHLCATPGAHCSLGLSTTSKPLSVSNRD